MTTLSGSGISMELPAGWEGRIYRRPPEAHDKRWQAYARGDEAAATFPVVHAANFPIPADVADYGGGAVETMTGPHLLVILLEFGPESAGTALFAPQGAPRLITADFSRTQLQRMIEGQGGTQRFFSVNGRPFCLYVVLGSYARRMRTVPVVNELLSSLQVS